MVKTSHKTFQILRILFTLAVLAGIGGLIYYYVFRDDPPIEEKKETPPNDPGSTPPIDETVDETIEEPVDETIEESTINFVVDYVTENRLNDNDIFIGRIIYKKKIPNSTPITSLSSIIKDDNFESINAVGHFNLVEIPIDPIKARTNKFLTDYKLNGDEPVLLKTESPLKDIEKLSQHDIPITKTTIGEYTQTELSDLYFRSAIRTDISHKITIKDKVKTAAGDVKGMDPSKRIGIVLAVMVVVVGVGFFIHKYLSKTIVEEIAKAAGVEFELPSEGLDVTSDGPDTLAKDKLAEKVSEMMQKHEILKIFGFKNIESFEKMLNNEDEHKELGRKLKINTVNIGKINKKLQDKIKKALGVEIRQKWGDYRKFLKHMRKEVGDNHKSMEESLNSAKDKGFITKEEHAKMSSKI